MRSEFDCERDWLADLSDEEKRRIVGVCEDCGDSGVVEDEGSLVDCHCPAGRTT